MATNYSINYEDERFKNVQNQEQEQLNQLNETYNNMVSQSDDFYQRQIDAVRDYNTTQQDLQNQQTDLAINEINQARDKAEKDYLREQRGAYSDWQKESNRYGANAEQMAASGLSATGYSESSQVSMYNTYQNRVATARESYNLAVQNYDNKIAEARLANNSRLAEIAYQSLQQELELSLNGFQYKNNLLLDQISKQQDINNMYYTRWQNVLSQMNTENAMAEQIRQYNEDMKFKKQQAKQAQKNWEKEYNLSKKASSSSRRSYSGGGGTGKNNDKSLKAPLKMGTNAQKLLDTYNNWKKLANSNNVLIRKQAVSALNNYSTSALKDALKAKEITKAEYNKLLKAIK